MSSVTPANGTRAGGPDELLYRTVYAGAAMQCFVPGGMLPPGALAVRVREEVLLEGERKGRGGDTYTPSKRLVTCAWATPCIVPALARPGGGGAGGVRPQSSHMLTPETFLWSAARCGPGVRLSSRKHSMRRDPVPGWGCVLGDRGMTSGRHAWCFAFNGRLSHVMVGIAAPHLPLDTMPSSSNVRTHGCIVWKYDGTFLAFGQPPPPGLTPAPQARTPLGMFNSQEHSLCIEGDATYFVYP